MLSKGIKPDIIIADAGYDSKKNYLITIAEDIIPIIAINTRNLKYKEKRDWESVLPIQRDNRFLELYKKRGGCREGFLKAEGGAKLESRKS